MAGRGLGTAGRNCPATVRPAPTRVVHPQGWGRPLAAGAPSPTHTRVGPCSPPGHLVVGRRRGEPPSLRRCPRVGGELLAQCGGESGEEPHAGQWGRARRPQAGKRTLTLIESAQGPGASSSSGKHTLPATATPIRGAVART